MNNSSTDGPNNYDDDIFPQTSTHATHDQSLPTTFSSFSYFPHAFHSSRRRLCHSAEHYFDRNLAYSRL